MVTEPSFFDLEQYLESESDRAAAVLGVAFLDNRLERVFKRTLHEDAPKSIFEFRGPLGDFSSRIDMAFALDLIDKDMRHDLHLSVVFAMSSLTMMTTRCGSTLPQ